LATQRDSFILVKSVEGKEISWWLSL